MLKQGTEPLCRLSKLLSKPLVKCPQENKDLLADDYNGVGTRVRKPLKKVPQGNLNSVLSSVVVNGQLASLWSSLFMHGTGQ